MGCVPTSRRSGGATGYEEGAFDCLPGARPQGGTSFFLTGAVATPRAIRGRRRQHHKGSSRTVRHSQDFGIAKGGLLVTAMSISPPSTRAYNPAE
jgi:hypothetical protein